MLSKVQITNLFGKMIGDMYLKPVRGARDGVRGV